MIRARFLLGLALFFLLASFAQGAFASSLGPTLWFSDSDLATCRLQALQLVSLASSPYLFGNQRTALSNAFSDFSNPWTQPALSDCTHFLLTRLSTMTQNSTGFGAVVHVGAFDASTGQGTVFVISDGLGGSIQMQLVNLAPHRVGFNIYQGGKVFCQWPDSQCILEADAPTPQYVSHTLPFLFGQVRIQGPLVFFTSQVGPHPELAQHCRLFPGSNPRGKIHVVFAPSGYVDMNQFFIDMSAQLSLLQESMGPLYSSLQISFVLDNVPCQNVALSGSAGQHFDRCDAVLPRQSCATNYVHVLINNGGQVRGSTYGTESNCNAAGMGCSEHELGHLLFGLPDRYCCDGSYHGPSVYRSLAECLAVLDQQSSVLNATFHEYLLDVLSNALVLKRDVSPLALVSELNRTMNTPAVCMGLNSSFGVSFSVLNQNSFMADLGYPAFSQDELVFIQQLLNVSVTPETERTEQMSLQLDFVSNHLSLSDLQLLNGVYNPFLAPLSHSLNYSYFSANGSSLGSYLFQDPRFVGGDVQGQSGLSGISGFDPNASFSVMLPYVASANRLGISDENGSLTSINLSISQSPYCQAKSYLSDGLCDPRCPFDIDCQKRVPSVSGSAAKTATPVAFVHPAQIFTTRPASSSNGLTELYAAFLIALIALFILYGFFRGKPPAPYLPFAPPPQI